MARKSSFTIRAQKHVQYTDAKEDGEAVKEKKLEKEDVWSVCKVQTWWRI